MRRRIIAGGDGQHVFIGPAPKLREAVELHRAGVGDQKQLRAFEHQDPGALRKLPVITDHRADFYDPVLRVQVCDKEAVAGIQNAFVVRFSEIADMDFGIAVLQFSVPVEKADRVSRLRLVPFQKGDGNGHIQVRSQLRKALYKKAVAGGGALPQSFLFTRKAVSAAPHLRKKRNVRALFFRLKAGLDPLIQVFFQTPRRKELQKRDRKLHIVLRITSDAPQIPIRRGKRHC